MATSGRHRAAEPVSRRTALKLAAIGAVTYGLTRSGAPVEPPAPPAREVLRGVNLNGPEFGVGRNLGGTGSGDTFSNLDPGTHDGSDLRAYHYPTDGDFAYLAGRGVGMVRLPVRWERLQPTWDAPLEPAELGRLEGTLDLAAAHGIRVVPALASYGAYWVHEDGVGVRRAIGSARGPGIEQFADFWSRLATALAGRPSLAAYGLTGEPLLDAVDGYSATALWERAAQAACEAVAAVDPATPIAVSVYGYNLYTDPRVSHGGGPWITGVANPIWYEAHQYFTLEDEGTSYARAVEFAESLGYTAGDRPDALHTRAVAEIDAFHSWLEGETGYIGETGWAKDESAERWSALAARTYERFNDYGFHVTAWCAGAWWPPTENLLVYGASRSTSSAAALVLDTAYVHATVIEDPANLTHRSRSGLAPP
ncbi:glycoside hydrolase family 5 protein [Candidatus Blastococcus massiliensis]|uniref:glycoside hydrolase family 5 protein n=1 Tax=Candidatus Blastococcus massiliensis TaxID=1470358 RepID=UPI0004BA19D4|nr:cellulase family glycosylhydrolase [Candidatus Blastococcus massiliensis]